MIIPKEKPYMDGLNSYYLVIENFVEHLQGEIGTGCIYFKSSTRELLVYFDEMDMLCGVIQDSGEHAQVAPSLQPVFDALKNRNYLVKVFHLDPHAIFYWAQMPPYKRDKNEIDSAEMPLDHLIAQLAEKKANCFVDVKFSSASMNTILFFHDGNFVGASYSWGAGGMNPSKQEYETFIKTASGKKAVFNVGHFTLDSSIPQAAGGETETGKEPEEKKGQELAGEDQVFITNLPTALEEFLDMYIKTAKKKAHVDPVALMQQRIIVRADDYPFMDPFNPPFDYSNGEFLFTGTDNAFGENTAKAIIECSWDVVKELRLEKKFRAVLEKWGFKNTLEERGYTVIK
jgi:hypothetical protein